jgi:uncharacterized membrane protein
MDEPAGATDDARDLAIKRLKAKRAFMGTLVTAVGVMIVLTVIWALSGGGYFWPIWAAFGLGIALVSTGWAAYGRGAQPITEAEIQEEMNKSR